ncbi:MAG: hypothetical protein AVDCRST_MAG91-3223 [uncultured Sphingomonadaceae bacterium]|uniref:Fibronectin type-III domain-containing protein n=1 Tax=uncultured Sphingomonadaceae bacterium TaxID=169976 RepID=A0A6J4TW68_9SPHN|nr:MAG: hypothetical protein AVDCRST_MAG91-3223 [uncultured Sphingomonadaceae bacterium]
MRYPDETIDLTAGMQEPAGPIIGGRPLRGENVNAGGKPYPLGVYAYRVRAVNGLSVVGGPSPLVYTFPAAVQGVAAREEGRDQTRLRWEASKQAGIKGYLVYRQQGRYDKEPMVRLTPEAIAGTEFLDESSGDKTRRYEVVAVDALGQEGEPSQPVWSRRQYREFYKPYVDAWHQ